MIKVISISKNEVEVSQENCYITDDDTAMSIANVFVDADDEEADPFRGYHYNEMGMVFIKHNILKKEIFPCHIAAITINLLNR